MRKIIYTYEYVNFFKKKPLNNEYSLEIKIDEIKTQFFNIHIQFFKGSILKIEKV